ncbi:unnamed protein product [Protopolystoma xenopodis]|uniref:Uncharacterized protein n=1 Tax=Protopolystoma xenopodis TaxID=117903 RepID=A0A3S5AM23_9PLAT|nr:unnamed protein product [Protopolystoma xenopodis]
MFQSSSSNASGSEMALSHIAKLDRFRRREVTTPESGWKDHSTVPTGRVQSRPLLPASPDFIGAKATNSSACSLKGEPLLHALDLAQNKVAHEVKQPTMPADGIREVVAKGHGQISRFRESPSHRGSVGAGPLVCRPEGKNGAGTFHGGAIQNGDRNRHNSVPLHGRPFVDHGESGCLRSV